MAWGKQNKISINKENLFIETTQWLKVKDCILLRQQTEMSIKVILKENICCEGDSPKKMPIFQKKCF